jgi:hypothetical protein
LSAFSANFYWSKAARFFTSGVAFTISSMEFPVSRSDILAVASSPSHGTVGTVEFNYGGGLYSKVAPTI